MLSVRSCARGITLSGFLCTRYWKKFIFLITYLKLSRLIGCKNYGENRPLLIMFILVGYQADLAK